MTAPGGVAPLRFDGRTAIVTGAGRGIGRAHALLLAARGANVVVNDLGTTAEGRGDDDGPATTVVREILDAGGRAVASTTGVNRADGAQAIVDLAIEEFGGVDIVVNNAGIVTSHEIPVTGPEDLENELAVHLVGAFHVTRAAWPHMVAGGYGRIVMTTSCGIFGSPVLLSYGAAKAGVIGLARNLATNGTAHGIKVNMVAPYALTRMADPDLPTNRVARSEVAEDAASAELFSWLLPEQVSAVVAYLAHDSCAVTGEIYGAGGGLVTRIFIAETTGVAYADLTPELVATHWNAINDRSAYTVPADIVAYTNDFVARVPSPVV